MEEYSRANRLASIEAKHDLLIHTTRKKVTLDIYYLDLKGDLCQCYQFK